MVAVIKVGLSLLTAASLGVLGSNLASQDATVDGNAGARTHRTGAGASAEGSASADAETTGGPQLAGQASGSVSADAAIGLAVPPLPPVPSLPPVPVAGGGSVSVRGFGGVSIGQ
jgi:hypothetical protein